MGGLQSSPIDHDFGEDKIPSKLTEPHFRAPGPAAIQNPQWGVGQFPCHLSQVITSPPPS